MISFADEAIIEVRSGKGGNGCVAFRREKYVPNGGPNGGDGGRGGDVYFCVKKNLRTLSHLRHKQVFKAKNGCDGEGSNRYGRDGEDVYVPLPPGTTVRDAETGELICEFTTESENEVFKFLSGGKGGWGNMHFKTSTNQAPRYAHEGKPGEVRILKVELSIMADCGLVGFPNAGKSSLLDYFTNARPKIAPYPFTTKIPNLGVLHVGGAGGAKDTWCANGIGSAKGAGRAKGTGGAKIGESSYSADLQDIIIADIPGIIEGASDGAGLGIRFLKHISRTSCLIFVIDVSDENYLTAFDTLKSELAEFSPELASKKHIVLLNKIDAENPDASSDCLDCTERAEELKNHILSKSPDETVLLMSVMERIGLGQVEKAIVSLVNQSLVDEENRFSSGSEMALNRSLQKKQSEFMKNRAVCSSETDQTPGSQSEGSGF